MTTEEEKTCQLRHALEIYSYKRKRKRKPKQNTDKHFLPICLRFR